MYKFRSVVRILDYDALERAYQYLADREATLYLWEGVPGDTLGVVSEMAEAAGEELMLRAYKAGFSDHISPPLE